MVVLGTSKQGCPLLFVSQPLTNPPLSPKRLTVLYLFCRNFSNVSANDNLHSRTRTHKQTKHTHGTPRDREETTQDNTRRKKERQRETEGEDDGGHMGRTTEVQLQPTATHTRRKVQGHVPVALVLQHTTQEDCHGPYKRWSIQEIILLI